MPPAAPLSAPRRFDYALLALFAIFCVCINLLWLQHEQRPPMDDDKRHVAGALLYYSVAHQDAPLGERMTRLVLWESSIGDGYPPFLYAVAGGVCAILGPSIHSTIVTVQIFLIILLFSCFELGYLLGGRAAAYAAVGAVFGSQVIIAGTRLFLLDLPMTALILLAYLMLMRSEGFRRRVPSILFGVFGAMAMLTKWASAFLLIAPFLYFSVPLLRRLDYRVLGAGLIATVGVLNCMLLTRKFVLVGSYGLTVQQGFALGSSPVNWGPPALWVAGSLLAMLVAWSLLRRIARRGGAPRQVHFFEALIFAQMVAAPWYVWHLSAVLALPVRNYSASFTTWSNALADAAVIAIQVPCLSLLLLTGLLASLLRLFPRARIRPFQGPTFLAALTGFLFLGFGVATHWRYTMPIIPFAGLAATFWLPVTGRLAWGEVVFLVAGALYQWAGWLMPAAPPAQQTYTLTSIVMGRPRAVLEPDRRSYGFDRYLAGIDEIAAGGGAKPPHTCVVLGLNLAVATFCEVYQMEADDRNIPLCVVGFIREKNYWAPLFATHDWIVDVVRRREQISAVIICSEDEAQFTTLVNGLQAPIVRMLVAGSPIQGRIELLEEVHGLEPDPRIMRYLGKARTFRARVVYPLYGAEAPRRSADPGTDRQR